MTNVAIGGGLLLGFNPPNSAPIMQSEARRAQNAAALGAARSETSTLLVRCAGADAGAFRRLYEMQAPALYGIALRITRSQALAADAVHDAMLQVWRNAARYDPERGNADGWLTSLVRYRALDLIRRQRREATGLPIAEQVDEDPDAFDRLAASTEAAALRICLAEMDEPRRKLVLLAFVGGLSHSEIATKLVQPLGTVKSAIRRGLLALRACLERAGSAAR